MPKAGDLLFFDILLARKSSAAALFAPRSFLQKLLRRFGLDQRLVESTAGSEPQVRHHAAHGHAALVPERLPVLPCAGAGE